MSNLFTPRFSYQAIAALVVALFLTGSQAAYAAVPTITRGPFLQMPGPDQMLVVWHTDIAQNTTEVEYGTTLGLGTTTAGISSAYAGTTGGFRNSVQLSGLTPGTKYFYAVADNGVPLTTASVDYAFTTAPTHGTAQPIRIWTFGDSGEWPGRNGTEYEDSRNAYYDYVAAGDVNAAADATDVMLYLGDNAYDDGTDLDHQLRFFDPAPLATWLQQQPFLSAIGNHEGFSSNSVNQNGAYFQSFVLPTANELGTNGVASGTESYYSFDYGNIHFIVLDTEDVIEDLGGAGATMLAWLESDLIATSADWIIAAWHRPPYSRGAGHNSDTENNEEAAREEFLPILEDYGVDLVLSGHSHSYERTPLLDGFYTLSSQMHASYILDAGDGDPAGDGPYRKPNFGQSPHEGAVFVVTGAAADVRTFVDATPHRAMVRAELSVGTSVIEVDGDTLVGRFIDDSGTIIDTFQINKGAPACPVAPLSGCTPAGKAKLVVKKNADPTKDKAIWKAVKMAVDPLEVDAVTTSGVELALCVWDAGGPVLSWQTPNNNMANFEVSAPATYQWKSKKAGNYGYKDKEGSQDGLTKIKIKADPAKSVLLVKGKGGNTALPTPPVAVPITAQFINVESEACWGMEMTTVKKNADGSIVASAP